MSISGTIRFLAATLAGAALYVPLVLIPVAGPLASGYAAGWIARTMPQKAFWAGFASGSLGFLAWIFFILPAWNLKIDLISGIFLWIFLAWNIVAVMASGIGAVIGSMASSASRLLSELAARPREETSVEYETDAPVYVICPGCGASNPDGAACCDACGAKIEKP